MTFCEHVSTHEGPRTPARYGSWETQVCDACGMWFNRFHGGPGPWQAAETIDEAAKEPGDG